MRVAVYKGEGPGHPFRGNQWGGQTRSWEGFPLRSDVGEAPNKKDVPPLRDAEGNFVVYHGTSAAAAESILNSKTIKQDDIGAVGITTIPKLARSFGTQKGDPVVLEVVIARDWMSKQNVRHEVGGAGHSSFLIKSELPSSAIVNIKIYADQQSDVQKQLPIDRDSMKAIVQARMDIFQSEADLLAEKLYTGDITLGAWEEAMRKMSRELHSSLAAIAKGGWEEMSQSDWGKLGAQVKKQYKYLHGFAEYIDENRDNVSLGYLKARSHMYGEAAKAASYMAGTPLEIIQNLPWMPKDGSTECLVNCQCVWILEVTKVSRRNKTVLATWRLRPAEHCEDCVDRNGYKVTFTVPANTVVPGIIGGL